MIKGWCATPKKRGQFPFFTAAASRREVQVGVSAISSSRVEIG